jgi:aspartyl-tRNA(Asn)/glutamyl-tRNA(Gln) amidotransferase subunit B
MSTSVETSAAIYEPVIGLEVHVQLLTASKIFCSCSTRFGAPPNTNVCPVCLGMPGALPVLNRKAVEFATRAAMALNCRINETSIFARKNYFYPDLPKGYQISQYDKPLAEHGYIEITRDRVSTSSDGSPVLRGKDAGEGAHATKIGITRVHLEEDAGKSLHEGFPDSDEKTAIDLNRTGVPLIEIVSEPDITTPDEAYEYLTRLKEIILYTGVSDCNMEEGSLRCDANVSVRPRGQKELGTKAEIKNVNSFRFIRDALIYEIARQVEVIESGGKIVQETRLYNSSEGKTYSMRSKEQAHDYRYFPEPDLLPLVVDEKWKAEITKTLPELPEARRARLVKEYGITEYDAHVLTATKAVADYFEKAVSEAKTATAKRLAGLVQTELIGRLKARGLDIEGSPTTAVGLAASGDLVESGTVSGKMLKDLYDLSFARNKDFPEVYEEEGRPQQSSDTAELEKIVADVLQANPKQREQYLSGKETMQGFFVGQVMRASKGKANPQVVNILTRYSGRVPKKGELVGIQGGSPHNIFRVVDLNPERWQAEVELQGTGFKKWTLWSLLIYAD